ncbi:type II toxin-antitoxin system RelB/DinJ family antitoxin [Actinomyces faecalis]|uniref:type II toxin-antitoxin system RelB/DinJ family antitoxin n=1 Tax=Actinomyces faecalis TaxID=2722820 RepID=UPI001552D929|nr:type II toxin-antitoxin system RelB/DinJ family antitoxin [Actinomyces faecalis]
MATITVRVEDSVKEGVTQIAEDFGFDLSSVTRAFYLQMIREHRIPLNLSYPQPSAASREAIEQTRQIIASGQHTYDTAEAMYEDLGF